MNWAGRSDEIHEPVLGGGLETPVGLAPIQPHFAGMEGLIRQDHPALVFLRHFTPHKSQVDVLVGPVDLVPQDGVAYMSQVNADLMFAARFWGDSQ